MPRVLIVDDIAENLMFLEMLLGGNGFEVHASNNGREALEAARSSPPDLIVSDILMPLMDGYTLCREWKSDDRLKGIPFIFYTATYTGPKDEALGLKLGAVRFVVKPQEPDVLLGIIREVLAEASRGGQRGLAGPSADAGQLAREYGEAVSRKLEAKLAALERTNRELERQIAERKRAERELQESRHLIDGVVENVPFMIFLKEATDLRFVLFNRAGEELLGRGRRDVLGKNDLELFPAEQAALFRARDRMVLEGGGPVEVLEEPVLTAKRGVRLLHTRKVCTMGGDGVTKYVLGISEDITGRKAAEVEHAKLEEQLRVSQKMEAIGILAGGVAHDFNNLLSVILSYTGFALDGARKGATLVDDLVEVRKAAERAVALTRHLLAFSRKQVLQPVPLNLNQIAEGIEKMLRRILGEDIDFLQALAPNLGVVQADPGQMEQVLMNLVVNARDAMPNGGKLTIETSNAELDEEYTARHVAVKPGPYVVLAVTDTGCGMDQQTQARIFEPFFTTKEKGKGTGLGLSTVYGIVRQSGGNVWVYSEPGVGTTFKVYLPRDFSAAAAKAIVPPPIPRRHKGTETILVVEDEEALTKVARRTLAAAGYTVLTAGDGEEALRIAAAHAGDIQLLATDVIMPRMGGRALATELAKSRPGLKVLYMSGYTDDAILHHGVLDPGTNFLAKPFTSVDLESKVREVLDGCAIPAADRVEKAVEAGAGAEEPPLDKEALGTLSRDDLDRLCRAVIAARYDEVIESVESIGATEPRLAAGLRRLADRFDYEGLRRLLSQ